MSWETWTVDGFGVNISELKFKNPNDLFKILMEMAEGTEIKKDFLEFMKDNEYEDKDWIDAADYYVESDPCDNGIAFLVTSIINEKENLGLDAIGNDDDSCAFIAICPRYPFKQVPENILHNREWYAEILRKYLQPLVEDGEYIPVDYFSAHYSG